MNPGVSMIIPISFGKSTSLPTRLPSTTTSPWVGLMNPQMHFISMVLPEPLRPISPWILPSSKDTFMCLSISVLPRVRSRSFTSIIFIIVLLFSNIFMRAWRRGLAPALQIFKRPIELSARRIIER